MIACVIIMINDNLKDHINKPLKIHKNISMDENIREYYRKLILYVLYLSVLTIVLIYYIIHFIYNLNL